MEENTPNNANNQGDSFAFTRLIQKQQKEQWDFLEENERRMAELRSTSGTIPPTTSTMLPAGPTMPAPPLVQDELKAQLEFMRAKYTSMLNDRVHQLSQRSNYGTNMGQNGAQFSSAATTPSNLKDENERLKVLVKLLESDLAAKRNSVVEVTLERDRAQDLISKQKDEIEELRKKVDEKTEKKTAPETSAPSTSQKADEDEEPLAKRTRNQK